MIINKSVIISMVVLCSIFVFIHPLKSEVREKNPKPNFIFIFTDDQRFDMANALGNKDLFTPNMDKMVKEGVTFRNAYNMGSWSGAVCVASRAMLISGLSVWNAKKSQSKFKTEMQEKLWPKIMEGGGYETYMSGKWHIQADPKSLFHHVKNVRPGMANQTPEGYNRPKNAQDSIWQPWNTKFDGYWKGGKHWTEVLADDGIDFIHQAEGSDKPFFMYLAFNAPHDPRQSPKEYVDKYPIENINLPKNYLNLYPYKDSIGLGPNLRDEALAPFPRTPFSVKTHIQEYNAIVSHLDDQIGRILDALEKSGKKDNTYIIFSSDHGLAVGQHGLMGKQNMFDHSIRVPLVIIGPSIPKNKRLTQQVYLQDIMATTMDLAGIKKEKHIEFNSLMPYVLNNKTKSVYSSIYGCYLDLQRMVRTEDYKLIVYPKADKILLFDIRKDPDEMNNLSDNPKYSKIKIDLMKELQKLQQQYNDPLDFSLMYSSYYK